MRFGKLIKYIPALIAGIYLGACDTPKDTSEVSSSMADSTIISSTDRVYNQIAFQDSFDYFISRADSNYKSVISGLVGINESLDSIHYDLVGLHEIMVAIIEKHAARASLDSVASSPQPPNI